MSAVLLPYLPTLLIGLGILVVFAIAMPAAEGVSRAVREEPALPAVLILLVVVVIVALAYGPRG